MRVIGCARCGGEHDVEPERLERPIKAADIEITHWSPCPNNGQPILIQVMST
jgi:hypothetical protein